MKMMSDLKARPDCHCQDKPRPCYECEYNQVQRRRPQLASDCIVVESLVCSQRVSVVAELAIPIPTLGDIISIGPGGVIDPPLSLRPDISHIVSQTTVLKDMIVITGDRKSTRLNSSHVSISYAVFCLKKKKYSYMN